MKPRPSLVHEKLNHMHTKRLTTLLTCLFLACACQIFGQEAVPIQSQQNHIRTVQLAPVSGPAAPPFVSLSGEPLRLSFDLVGDQAPHCFLRFQHCTFDWFPSPDLEPADFMDGFQEPAVEVREASFGTKVNYTHYEAVFPNDLTRFTKSGNYIVQVIDPARPDAPLLTKRFVLYEHLSSFTTQLREPPQLEEIRTHQAIDFTLHSGEYPLLDAYEALQVVVVQNGFWSHALAGLVPRFVRGAEIDFRTADLANFPGGNTWRFADLKSLRFVSQGVARIEEGERFWHFYLEADERRAYKTFDARPDINGRFIIHNDQFEGATESDYVMAHFRHPVAAEYPGDLYLVGAFSAGQLDDAYKLQWDDAQQQYEATVMLKQGYYNYMYAFVPNLRRSRPSASPLPDWYAAAEGNHHVAGNRYDFFAYYWDIEGYDRVIGHEVLESGAR